MSTRHGMVARAARTLSLVLAFALSGAPQSAGAQLAESTDPLDIVPRLGIEARLAFPHPDVLISEGRALYEAGRYKEAAASFERAMQLGVDRPHEAARSVARSYAKLGNRKQAVRWAEIAELLEEERWPQRRVQAAGEAQQVLLQR